MAMNMSRVCEKTMENPIYLNLILLVCPEEKKIFDNYRLNFVIQNLNYCFPRSIRSRFYCYGWLVHLFG